MKVFRFPPLVIACFAVALTAGFFAFAGDAGEEAKETSAAAPTTLKSPPVPKSHRSLLKALSKMRPLDIQKQTVRDSLQDLSRSLGVPIVLHESAQKAFHPNGTFSLRTEEPVSHRTGIQQIMRQFGSYQYGIVFEENQLTIVVGNEYTGASLRTYDLSGRSNFSLAERERIIQSILAEVQPESWTAKNPFWIQPGESVFEIDVYQSQTAHEEIAQKTMSHHSVVTIDKHVQTLFDLNFTQPGEKPKNLEDKKAAVLQLRKKYAYESIAKRLQYEAGKADVSPKLSPRAREMIETADKQFDQIGKSQFSFHNLRSRSLEQLHEQEVEAFVNRPGFGLSRMPQPGPSYLQETLPRDMPLASNEMIQTGENIPVQLPATKAAASTRRVSLPSEEALLEFHQNGKQAFLSPPSFGFVKSRDQVAGFQSHAFSFAPRIDSHLGKPRYRKQKETWAIHRLELVSLLKHDNPAVYVSRNLPRMDKLKTVPTRPLSGFERSGLKRLYEGEDVVTAGELNRIKMIGSLRATKQCQQCHDVKSGTLLGAFSYELLRDPQLDPQKHKQELSKPVL